MKSQMDLWEEVRNEFIKNNNALKYLSEHYKITFMRKEKLTGQQIEYIKILRQYDEIVMDDGWLTGGHGICFDLRTVRALERKKIIVYDRLSELGKTIEL